MQIRNIVLALAAVSALAVPACGDDEKKAQSAETTPAAAIEEANKTSVGLTTALKTYKDGDKAAAEEQVSETYLQHFELVEGPLEEVDHELNEELEEAISTDLRGKVADGAPAAEVRRLVADIKADLETAERKLK